MNSEGIRKISSTNVIKMMYFTKFLPIKMKNYYKEISKSAIPNNKRITIIGMYLSFLFLYCTLP